MKNKLTLQEIAGWQLNQPQSEVELPPVQRGFVWKPNKVEDLWDSLLRGYPIGSFLLSKNGKKYDLLDGQQRATSIFLGYFNPFSPSKEITAWSIKGELPVLWIDIKPNEGEIPNTSKYLVRMTTRSHPWGYQAKNNIKPLSSPDIRKALQLFKKHKNNKKGTYTFFKNTTIFPYDAWYPLPLSFFIESESAEQVIEKAGKLPYYICTKHRMFKNKNDFLKKLRSDLNSDLSKIFNKVKKIKNKKYNYDIASKNVMKEEHKTDEPTLFKRINSSGVPLSTDDMIYSIYKHILPETKDLVEKIGIDNKNIPYIPPTQAVSLASRLVWSTLNGNGYHKKMKVREFQQYINDPKMNFKNELKEMIEKETIKDLFIQAIGILSCKNIPSFKGLNAVPPVIVKQFIKHTPDLFLFLIYWLHINNKIKPDINMQLKIAAKLYTFSWFDFTNVHILWEEKEYNNKDFWQQTIDKYIWQNEESGTNFLIPPDKLHKYYLQKNVINQFIKPQDSSWYLNERGAGKDIRHYFEKIKKGTNKKNANKYFTSFIDWLWGNKSLVIFAQRRYINSKFKDYNQMEDIEDTNVPWDWDHIYPKSYLENIKKKNDRPQVISDWNGNIGNLRAISFEQNREEGDRNSPKERLTKPKNQDISFVSDNNWKYWQKIGNPIKNTDKENKENYFRAVTTRMINIYEKYWNDFKIKELIS